MKTTTGNAKKVVANCPSVMPDSKFNKYVNLAVAIRLAIYYAQSHALIYLITNFRV